MSQCSNDTRVSDVFTRGSHHRVIEQGPTDLITSICECSLNVLKGVIPLTLSQKRRLARYKTHLRALANKKVSRKQKKKHLINQKGGNLLTALLPPVLSVLGSLLVKK